MKKIIYKIKGFGLIEVIIAVVIMTIFVTVGATMFITARRSAGQAFIQNTAAITLAETREMLEHMRNQDADLLSNGSFYLTRELEFSSWLIQSELPDDDLFVRQVTIEDALRHSADDHLYMDGDTGASYADPNTKKVTIQILWAPEFTPSSLLSNIIYFSNWDESYTF